MGIGLWIKALELQVGIIPKEALETFSSVLEVPWALFSRWKQTGRKKKETMDFGRWKTGCAAPWFLREGKQIRRALGSSQLTPQGIFRATVLRGKQKQLTCLTELRGRTSEFGEASLIFLRKDAQQIQILRLRMVATQNNDLQKMPTS